MLEADGHQLEPLFDVLVAWASLVIGLRTNSVDLIRDAAARFTRVFSQGTLQLQFEVPPALFLRTLVRCHFWAGSKVDALEWAQRWTFEDPKNPDAWHILSRCARETGDGDGFVDAYEHYVRLSDSTDHNWEVTELLGLGLERRNHSRLLAEIEKMLSARERPASRAILELEWPAFTRLSAKAQDKWWLGMAIACDPASRTTLGDDRWSVAVTPSAEALRLEFGYAVFDPFLEWLESSHQLVGLRQSIARDQRRDAILTALQKGEATLGQMLALFREANGHGTFGPLLYRWLTANRPNVLKFVKDNDLGLKRVNTIRNAGTHDVGTAEMAWLEVYLQTKSALEVLVTPEGNHQAR
jgi:hypothetical protein